MNDLTCYKCGGNTYIALKLPGKNSTGLACVFCNKIRWIVDGDVEQSLKTTKRFVKPSLSCYKCGKKELVAIEFRNTKKVKIIVGREMIDLICTDCGYVIWNIIGHAKKVYY